MAEDTPRTKKERIRAFAERWKSVAEVVFSGTLVVFTALLFYVNRDYARTARNAERPWLGPFGLVIGYVLNPSYTLTANQPIDIVVVYKNFGRSPAMSHTFSFSLVVGGPPPTKLDEWTEDSIPDPACRSKLKKIIWDQFFQEVSNRGSQCMGCMRRKVRSSP